jgi:hypothetical protein
VTAVGYGVTGPPDDEAKGLRVGMALLGDGRCLRDHVDRLQLPLAGIDG